MNMPELLIGEAVKLYVNRNGHLSDRAINCASIGRIVGSQQSVIWRQIHQARNINTESFLRLMVAMDNLWLDKEKNFLIIGLTGEQPYIDIVDRFTHAHFKKNYL